MAYRAADWPRQQYWTIADIKAANRAAGRHFFDQGAMRFFNSRILPTVFQGPGGIYFVTSEKYDSSLRGPGSYSIRKFFPSDASIEGVGEFQSYASAEEAKRDAKRFAAHPGGVPTTTDKYRKEPRVNPFRDRRGREWPQQSLRAYQREPEFWENYVNKLRDLAASYRRSGNEEAARATEDDAKDILDALRTGRHNPPSKKGPIDRTLLSDSLFKQHALLRKVIFKGDRGNMNDLARLLGAAPQWVQSAWDLNAKAGEEFRKGRLAAAMRLGFAAQSFIDHHQRVVGNIRGGGHRLNPSHPHCPGGKGHSHYQGKCNTDWNLISGEWRRVFPNLNRYAVVTRDTTPRARWLWAVRRQVGAGYEESGISETLDAAKASATRAANKRDDMDRSIVVSERGNPMDEGPTLTQKEFVNLKRRLTIAKSKGHQAVIREVSYAMNVFAEKGYPDDWRKWAVAKDDAELAIRLKGPTNIGGIRFNPASPSLLKKLHPNRFTAMSPKMAAIVAYVLGVKWTSPAIGELVVTSDGHVLARREGDIGANDFIGSYADLSGNWSRLMTAAELTPPERLQASRLFKARIG